MSIRVHIFHNKQRDTKMMMIHTFKNGKLVSSSTKFPYCDKTIKLYSRGHKEVEIVYVASSYDLNIHLVSRSF